tara:strand:+ start:1537 stop:2475 length:939 start_codon:yes stop_codon:yes gene_type:complete
MITFSNLGHYGRLANQLFQYGILYVVSKKNGYDFAIPSDNLTIVDSSPNPVIGKRDYMYLQIYECFELSGKLLPRSEIRFDNTFDHGMDYSKYVSEVFNVSDHTNFKGSFQSYKYFEGFEEGLKKEFQFKNIIEQTTKDYFDELKDRHGGKTITGIHVRRGDTIGEDHIHNGQLGGCLVLPNSNWYDKMIEELRSNDNIFLVISDDNKWCEENIKGDDVFYSRFSAEGHDKIRAEYLDLCLITHCDDFVMSCSTFSWWGAWLSKTDGEVYVPDRWWGRRYHDRNEEDIRLPKWNQVRVESDYDIWGPDGTRY